MSPGRRRVTDLRTGAVLITAVWLRREGMDAVVLIERDGQWCEVIREHCAHESQFSHIAEAALLAKATAVVP